ncbi:hypothetical protein GCM10011571_35680 [Marinithermofilum abyssi]|uniref:Uncharacterized protein n=1 Tax=Marinithermofilum abyssi TaxID=1571185 RepID=A0A8J2YF21_9BACL|nr:hypothetical protein GCM10011571_35680 [Marinithermofilum abyssi]
MKVNTADLPRFPAYVYITGCFKLFRAPWKTSQQKSMPTKNFV